MTYRGRKEIYPESAQSIKQFDLTALPPSSSSIIFEATVLRDIVDQEFRVEDERKLMAEN